MKNLFFPTFQAYVRHFESQHKEDLKEWYQSDKTWTKKFFSPAKTLTKGSNMGDYFQEKIEGSRYRTEDGLFDMSMTLHKNFEGITSLDRDYETFDWKPEWEFFPTHYDVLIEHENNMWSSWQEISKLAYAKATLKVLVTYHGHKSDPEKWRKEKELLEGYFRSILSQANADFPENSGTEYLLILGNMENDKLTWYASTFNYLGERTGKVNF